MIGLAGGAALAAVLGLTGCDGAKDDGTDGLSAGAELQNGSPASASLDQLPLPEQGKLYNNPLGRDQIRDGGDLVLPLSELGPNWNYFSVGGNSTYMKALWANYMPINLFLVSADASSFTPNPAYLSDYREEMVDGKEVCTLTFRDEATFNDGTPMDYRAIKAVWDVMGGKDPAYEPSATDGYANIESVSPGATCQFSDHSTAFSPAASLKEDSVAVTCLPPTYQRTSLVVSLVPSPQWVVARKAVLVYG